MKEGEAYFFTDKTKVWFKDALWECEGCNTRFDADHGSAAWSGMEPENPECPKCLQRDWVVWLANNYEGADE